MTKLKYSKLPSNNSIYVMDRIHEYLTHIQWNGCELVAQVTLSVRGYYLFNWAWCPTLLKWLKINLSANERIATNFYFEEIIDDYLVGIAVS